MSIAPLLAGIILGKSLDDDKPSGSSSSGAAKVITKTIREEVPVVDEDTKKLLKEDLETKDRVNISLKEYNALKEASQCLKKYETLVNGIAMPLVKADGIPEYRKKEMFDRLISGSCSIDGEPDPCDMSYHVFIHVR